MTKQLLLIIAIAGSLMGLTGCAVDGYVESQPADVVYTGPWRPALIMSGLMGIGSTPEEDTITIPDTGAAPDPAGSG